MEHKLILSDKLLELTISRLAWQVYENTENFNNTAIIGLQPRGVHFAKRLHQRLEQISQETIHYGYLDTTFHRDDFRRRKQPAEPNQTHIPFLLEEKRVVLIDDVLYTGRTIRAALDAMIAFGRPAKVDLLVLIERRYSRELPVDPVYIGRQVNTLPNQKVRVQYIEQGFEEDKVWLVTDEH